PSSLSHAAPPPAPGLRVSFPPPDVTKSRLKPRDKAGRSLLSLKFPRRAPRRLQGENKGPVMTVNFHIRLGSWMTHTHTHIHTHTHTYTWCVCEWHPKH